jgi:hypothetical protein
MRLCACTTLQKTEKKTLTIIAPCNTTAWSTDAILRHCTQALFQASKLDAALGLPNRADSARAAATGDAAGLSIDDAGVVGTSSVATFANDTTATSASNSGERRGDITVRFWQSSFDGRDRGARATYTLTVAGTDGDGSGGGGGGGAAVRRLLAVEDAFGVAGSGATETFVASGVVLPTRRLGFNYTDAELGGNTGDVLAQYTSMTATQCHVGSITLACSRLSIITRLVIPLFLFLLSFQRTHFRVCALFFLVFHSL